MLYESVSADSGWQLWAGVLAEALRQACGSFWHRTGSISAVPAVVWLQHWVQAPSAPSFSEVTGTEGVCGSQALSLGLVQFLGGAETSTWHIQGGHLPPPSVPRSPAWISGAAR